MEYDWRFLNTSKHIHDCISLLFLHLHHRRDDTTEKKFETLGHAYHILISVVCRSSAFFLCKSPLWCIFMNKLSHKNFYFKWNTQHRLSCHLYHRNSYSHNHNTRVYQRPKSKNTTLHSQNQEKKFPPYISHARSRQWYTSRSYQWKESYRAYSSENQQSQTGYHTPPWRYSRWRARSCDSSRPRKFYSEISIYLLSLWHNRKPRIHRWYGKGSSLSQRTWYKNTTGRSHRSRVSRHSWERWYLGNPFWPS